MTIAGLVVASVALIFSPHSLRGWLVNLIQPLMPFHRAMSAIADAARFASGSSSAPISRDAYDAAMREREALEHTTAALSAKVDELQTEVQALTATRQRTIEGRAIGGKGRLIPVQILGEDIVGWRDSRLIDAGSISGVQRGAEAVSAYFTAETDPAEKIRSGLAILRAEVLIGWVESAGLYSARVRLTSDPATQVKVRIGRHSGSTFKLADRYFWLVGRGQGRMEIRDVERGDVDRGIVQAGDSVMSDPLSELLPTAMTIGRVSSIGYDRDNPLFAILAVDSAAPIGELRKVYVYDPQVNGTE